MAAVLFKHLRVYQIFGANTSVGKTILATALVRSSACDTFYLKPVSTGPDSDADTIHIKRHAGSKPRRGCVQTECLWKFKDPVSPHLAARMASDGGPESAPTGDSFVSTIASHIKRCAALSNGSRAHLYIETAGGVHSPTPFSTTQADAYRPLLLPTILVGSSQLGGISATISAYESLLLRGYTVDCIVLFQEQYYRNSEYLAHYFARHDPRVHVQEFLEPPPRLPSPEEDLNSMEKFYEDVSASDNIATLQRLLDDRHSSRIMELDSMPRRTLDTIWWPFVQHGLVKSEKDVTVIDSAHSDYFSVYHSPDRPSSVPSVSVLQPHLDSSASWWTQILGHAHPALTLAAARAAGRYGHVMFPQSTHLPALRLAEWLVHEGPGKGWVSRVFFSDNGSTGMEVALKMALRTFCVAWRDAIKDVDKRRLGILGIRGSYHGDTIGAMDACEEGIFTCEWHDAKGYWFDPPTVSVRRGRIVLKLPPAMAESWKLPFESGFASLSSVYDISQRLDSPLAAFYRSYITDRLVRLQENITLAALVLEPLVMGAGGMVFVDPLFQRVLIDVVRAPLPCTGSSLPEQTEGLPVVFDEVFVGLYRVGVESGRALLGVAPDIAVYAKALTGGLVPLAATLASERVFRAFWGTRKADALLHGHSYTAHAVGCEVALEALHLLDRLAREGSEGSAGGGAWNEAKASWAAFDASRAASTSHAGRGQKQTVWSFWDPRFVDTISHQKVVIDVMTLGTVLAIGIEDEQAGYGSDSAQNVLRSLRTSIEDADPSTRLSSHLSFNVHFRTLGNVAYFMTSLNTPPAIIRALEDKIYTALHTK